MAKQAELRRVARFLLVGGANTLIDFLVLFLLTGIGIALWPANMASTAVALIFSYFANRKFTFQSQQQGLAQLARFVGITLVGLWILQPLVIQGIMPLLAPWVDGQTALLVAKLCATTASLTWNFVLYRFFVFRTEKGT